MNQLRKILGLVLLVLLPKLVWVQCNIQASVCDAATSPPFGFIDTSGAYAGGSFVNAGCNTGAGGNQSYGFITLYISASGNLNLLIDANTNGGFIDVAIFKIPNGVAPCIAIQNGQNAIGCNYAAASGGCVQFGNAFPCGSSVGAPLVNAGDVIMIIAQNWTGTSGNTSFTLNLGNTPGSAQAGLPDATINNSSTAFCLNAPPTQLTAVNNGGTWSGVNGLTPSGMFDPALAGVGEHQVNYTIGTGVCQDTDSNIITVRSISISDTVMSNCMPGGFYNFSGIVNIDFPPDSGDLIVTNCKGDTIVLASAPFTESSYPFTFTNMDADGLACNVEAYFTDFPCSQNIPYVAHECLSCAFVNHTVSTSHCNADNQFDVSGTIAFAVPPLTGQLLIQTCHGEVMTFDPPFVSPVNYSFANLSANGEPCTISAKFTDDICTLSIDFIAPTTPIVSTSVDTAICLGDFVDIGASGNSVRYTWDNTLNANASQIVQPTSETIYTVTGYNIEDCFTSKSIKVSVLPLPIVDFKVDQDQGCIPVRAVFSNLSVVDVAMAECVWTFDNDGTVVSCDSVVQYYTSPGSYGASLKVTSSDQCVGERYIPDMLNISPLPSAMFRALPSIYELSDPLVYFSNFSSGADTYIWDFGINNDTSHLADPSYVYPHNKEGTYTVTLIAISKDGCVDSIQHTVHGEEGLIFYIPNTFTPQGDGYNEEFRPILTSGMDLSSYHFAVMDRWGTVIFDTDDMNMGWNGQNGEIETESNTFVWRVELTAKRNNERKVYTGHVNLLR